MLRKLSIVPIFLAMMMVTLATVLPHHHHQTMICVVEDVCGMDGCCDDEHTHHSDANHNQDESHCVAQFHPIICRTDESAAHLLLMPCALQHNSIATRSRVPAGSAICVQEYLRSRRIHFHDRKLT